MSYHRNYCTECSWSASTEHYTRREVATRATNHFIQTNHLIESESVPEHLSH